MHSFDSFSYDHIVNNGRVGACDFGYGFYFGDESDAFFYSNAYLKQNHSSLDKEYSVINPDFNTAPRLISYNLLMEHRYDVQSAIKSIKPTEEHSRVITDFLAFLDTRIAGKRFVYKCQLFAGNECLVLPFLKPLSKSQCEILSQGLRSKGISIGINNISRSTFEHIQRELDNFFYNNNHEVPNKSTSMLLRDIGFKGIRSEQGIYVCWDTDCINIISKTNK